MTPCYWLSRRFRNPADFRRALTLDAQRWPEQDIPRTTNPLNFSSLLLRSAAT